MKNGAKRPAAKLAAVATNAKAVAAHERLVDDREFWQHKTVGELAAEQGVKPIGRLEEILGAGSDSWESDEEFEAFLRATRGEN